MEDLNPSWILEREAHRPLVAVHLFLGQTPSVRCELTGPRKKEIGRGRERLTARKYADSPGPSCAEPALYVAYGGPQARVSSPRTGCSILITSALRFVKNCTCLSPPTSPGTAELDSPEVPQDLRTVWLLHSQRSISSPIWWEAVEGRRTPAKTLVISKTRYPAKGRDSATEAVETNRAPCPGRRCLAQDRETLLLSSAEGNLVVRVNMSEHGISPQCPTLFLWSEEEKSAPR